MPRPPASRQSILTRPLVAAFAASFGTVMSFYLLLSVVPMYATSVGAGTVGAGLATGAMMFATMATELAVPRLVARFGYRLVCAAALLLIGAPALALPLSASMTVILALCVVRGVGLAVIFVVGSALVASLVPAERRGEGLGLYGVVVGVPSIVGLPLGVWLAGHVGFGPVFVAGALVALAPLAVVPGLPERAATPESPHGLLAGARTRALARPSLFMAVSALATSIAVTFLPLAIAHATGSLAALALLVQAATSTLCRWWAGHHGDRHGSARLLLPGVLAVVAGTVALARIDSAAAVLVGMALLGSGFGIVQNASLALMFDRVSPAAYDAVSALWNLAYDGGLGLGAAAFGVVSARTGYPMAFAITAGCMLVVLAPVWRDRAHAAPTRNPELSQS
ncbi:MAG TPA: MFS transporter [Gemmatimonadaceae bacterium]|nr:MFS transporter [Gemmatimonadaceae bacterium]